MLTRNSTWVSLWNEFLILRIGLYDMIFQVWSKSFAIPIQNQFNWLGSNMTIELTYIQIVKTDVHYVRNNTEKIWQNSYRNICGSFSLIFDTTNTENAQYRFCQHSTFIISVNKFPYLWNYSIRNIRVKLSSANTHTFEYVYFYVVQCPVSNILALVLKQILKDKNLTKM